MELSEFVFCPNNALCVVVKERTELNGQDNLPRPSASVNFYEQVVGVTGFEPVTLRLSSACSNQLSYRPVFELQIRYLKFQI